LFKIANYSKCTLWRERIMKIGTMMICMAIVAMSLVVSQGFAQCGCSTGAVVPTTTSYAPAAFVADYAPAATTTYYAPTSYVAGYAPTTTYYAPAPTTTYYAPATTVAYAPTTYVANYAPTTAYYAPAAYTVGYAPATTAYYAPVATTTVIAKERVGTSIYGTPKVYIRGEPVRNSLRAITP
jgi:hypothetical protein